jgi:uncharacterized membrane protein YkvA (DUF1232 family)
MWEAWKRRLRQLRRDTYALYLAYSDPRVPWHARLFAACVVGYVFSPIDLIPDFVPVIGYLDDLVLVPLGVVLALRMIPPEVWAECRASSEQAMRDGKPVSPDQVGVNWVAAGVIVLVWLALASLGLLAALRWLTVAGYV